MNIARWNYRTKQYDPYEPNPDWCVVLYTDDMETPINCTSCGRAMTYGQGYTSQELHNHVGLGFPVCAGCYGEESERRWGVVS